MTRIDKFRNASVEEMATYIYNHDDDLNDEICKGSHKECPFGDKVEPHNCLGCIKAWLESECEE